MNKYLINFTLISLVLFTCFNLKAENNNEDEMFPNMVMTKYHFELTKTEIAKAGTNRLKMSFIQNVRNPANQALNLTPTPVRSLTNNPQNIDVSKEMERIYNLCVAYLFTSDQKYLDKATEYLLDWADINTANSKQNIHESVYNKAVEGYSIIRNTLDATSRETIDNWIIARTNVFLADNDLRSNNWGTCLMYQMYLHGCVLNKTEYVNWFKTKYPTWVKKNLYPNGTGEDLLSRDAFAYHAYNLSFFGQIAHAIAMYEGYNAADNFYTQDIGWGASVEKSVNFWMPFLLDPVKNSHIEFKNTSYSPDLTRTDANKPYNPATTLYALDIIFEMDTDNIKPAIDKYRAGNVYATWALTLGGVRWEFGDGN